MSFSGILASSTWIFCDYEAISQLLEFAGDRLPNRASWEVAVGRKKGHSTGLAMLVLQGAFRLRHPEDPLQISGPVHAMPRKMQTPEHVEVKVKKQKVSRHSFQGT